MMNTMIFYRGIEKRASFPLVLVGAPRKGQAPGRVTPWIASVKALVWFWLIDETLSANLVYQVIMR